MMVNGVGVEVGQVEAGAEAGPEAEVEAEVEVEVGAEVEAEVTLTVDPEADPILTHLTQDHGHGHTQDHIPTPLTPQDRDQGRAPHLFQDGEDLQVSWTKEGSPVRGRGQSHTIGQPPVQHPRVVALQATVDHRAGLGAYLVAERGETKNNLCHISFIFYILIMLN